MKITNVSTMAVTDTWSMPREGLCGVLKFLSRYHGNKDWVEAHGPNGVHRFCIAFKMRCIKEGWKLTNRQLAMINQLDPPPCRCGKKGTRIIGSETFCHRCGPTDKKVYARKWVNEHYHEPKHRDIERTRDEIDKAARRPSKRSMESPSERK